MPKLQLELISNQMAFHKLIAALASGGMSPLGLEQDSGEEPTTRCPWRTTSRIRRWVSRPGPAVPWPTFRCCSYRAATQLPSLWTLAKSHFAHVKHKEQRKRAWSSQRFHTSRLSLATHYFRPTLTVKRLRTHIISFPWPLQTF